eukprot:7132526-Pyramimonas_sp.AAC.1
MDLKSKLKLAKGRTPFACSPGTGLVAKPCVVSMSCLCALRVNLRERALVKAYRERLTLDRKKPSARGFGSLMFWASAKNGGESNSTAAEGRTKGLTSFRFPYRRRSRRWRSARRSAGG